MGFDKSYGLWERTCVAGPEGLADQYDNIDEGISLMSHAIGKGTKNHMMHEHCRWTEVNVSNDLVKGHSVEGQEYRSIVRVSVSPRGDAPEKLIELLKGCGFKKCC